MKGQDPFADDVLLAGLGAPDSRETYHYCEAKGCAVKLFDPAEKYCQHHEAVEALADANSAYMDLPDLPDE